MRRCLVLLLVTAAWVVPLRGATGQGREGTTGGSGSVDVAPVVIDGRTLFRVRGILALPASRRAAAIEGRIRELAADPAFDPATLQIADDGRGSRIGPEARPVVRITDPDAELEDIDRRLLAEVALPRIRQAIADYRAARTRQHLLGGAARAGVATLIVVLLLLGGRFGFRALQGFFERAFVPRVKAVTIRSFEVVRAERIQAVARGLIDLLRGLAVLVVAVLYLRYVLSLFPWTWGAGSQIGGWILGPLAVLGEGLVGAIPNLVFLAVLAVITLYALRLIRAFFSAVGRREVRLSGFDPEWAEPTFKLLRIGVIAFAVVVAYPQIPGSSSAAFKGVSLFIGVVFSLGSTSVIANIIAGYTMVYRRAFREGDRVRIGTVVGDVTQVRLQVTHLRTPTNEEVVVPNSTILSSEVVNYSTLAKDPGLIVHTSVGIGYETPWRQVEAMLLEAAARTDGLLREPPPFVLQTALGGFAVTYQIYAYINVPRLMLRLTSALHRNILDVFNEYGVQIMTPAYEGDPAEPKVVPREKWHLAPASGAAGAAAPPSERALVDRQQPPGMP